MDSKATGALIAARRKQMALSQAELAEQLHVTDKAVSRWETGRGMPGLDSLEPLAEALGLSISELLSGKELSTEELPEMAGGQIMESMKREHKWKWLAWLAMAAVTLLAIWGTSASAQAQRERAWAEQERWDRYAHYASSVNPHEEGAMAAATADYFEGQGIRIRFNAKSLRIREWAISGDYLAFLFSDRLGEWCMSLWQRDEEYPGRFQIVGGRARIDKGVEGLMLWNFGDAENAIIVASGVELPEESWQYEWHNYSHSYSGFAFLDRQEQAVVVLDIFELENIEAELHNRPILYGYDTEKNVFFPILE